MTDLVYVAGKLNDDACGYIKNLAEMLDASCEIKLNKYAATICPGNDFLEGLWCGTMEYEDYTWNSLEQLKRCDAVYVLPGSENSNGVQKEIEEATKRGIPMFYQPQDSTKFYRWLKRPKILAIVGESGTGKTTAAEYAEEYFNIPLIKSYTDRPPRENDTSHTFLSKAQFSQIPQEEMISPTEFGGYRYCCLHKDVQPQNTYVIEEDGFLKLKNIYKSKYRVEGLRLIRDRDLRVRDTSLLRVKRDKYKFNLPLWYYDYIIENNGSLDEFKNKIGKIMGEMEK